MILVDIKVVEAGTYLLLVLSVLCGAPIPTQLQHTTTAVEPNL
jgi:hypothetical protein